MAQLHVCGELCRPARGGPDSPGHYGGPAPPVWAKTYGRPCDPFLRIVDTFELVGDVLHTRRDVLPRAYVSQVDIRIGFAGEPTR